MTRTTTQLLCSSAQTVNAPLCEANRYSTQTAAVQKRSKKHTLKQPMKQPMKQVIKQSARELARWCRNTESQYSTGSTLESKWLMLCVRSSIFRWYNTYCISVLTTNMHREWCSLQIAEDSTICINNCIVKNWRKHTPRMPN